MLELFRKLWMWLLVPILLSLVGGCKITEYTGGKRIESVPPGIWQYEEKVPEGVIVVRTAEFDPFEAKAVVVECATATIEGVGDVLGALIDMFGGLVGAIPMPEQPPTPVEQ